jgi:putative ABC transport system permease protein
METFFQDVKHSMRMFLKSPGFTITAVAALALGIGGTTAIFSIVNTVLLRPLGIPDPDRLVVLTVTPSDDNAASGARFVYWRSQSDVVQNVSAYFSAVLNYTGSQVVEQWKSTRASANFFHCFGIPILRGRSFTREEDLPSGPRVALVSQDLWKRRFASDPRMLGKTISLDGEAYTVIGIVGDISALRAYVPFSDVYVPFQIDPDSSDRGAYFDVVARLKPGISLDQARARLRASTREYRAKFPDDLGPKESFTAKRFREDMVGGDRPLLLVLLGAVCLVLLIACANVANLLLVRAASRRREIAIRVAIGAGRGRMIRQLLTESALLSLAGGALGLLLGYGGIRALLAINTAGLPMVGENGTAVAIDWRVMSFALLISLGTGIVFGLFPALEGSRADLNVVLKEGSGRSGGGPRQNKARALLVISEVGLAVVLLIGSGLLIRSFAALYSVDTGFDAHNVVTMNVLLTGPKYAKTASVADAIRTGLEQLRSLPGVTAASATCCLPLGEGTYDMNFDIVSRPAAASSTDQGAGWATVSPGYFDVLKIPVKRGRSFNAGDGSKSPAVAVINERMAQKYWKDGNALGERIAIGRGGGMKEFKDEPVRQIVGIVGDIRSEGLDTKPGPIMYIPQAQLPDAENAFFFRLLPLAWAVRTQGKPGGLTPAIQEQLRHSTGLPVTDVASMDQVVWGQTARQRFAMLLMGVFGSTALLLAAIGIYGLMAYTVEQRTREIGIRMALGAESSQVRNMVVRQGMSLAVSGVVAGLAAAWGLARLITSFLFGVQLHDLPVFIAVPVVLGMVALVAVYAPASRARRVNPIDSLRYE